MNRRNYKHGHTKRVGKRVVVSPTYSSWASMRSRCDRPQNASYYAYGAVGIKYDPRWEDFQVFLEEVGERPEGKTLDRIDSTKGYWSDNVRWATPKEQRANTRARRKST